MIEHSFMPAGVLVVAVDGNHRRDHRERAKWASAPRMRLGAVDRMGPTMVKPSVAANRVLRPTRSAMPPVHHPRLIPATAEPTNPPTISKERLRTRHGG
jgi:hypothetical protein